MSVFLTPDLTPVLGGTYYPPEDQHGRPGFKSVLLSVAKSVSCTFKMMYESLCMLAFTYVDYMFFSPSGKITDKSAIKRVIE